MSDRLASSPRGRPVLTTAGLEKALDIGPDNSLAKLFLAEAYLKEDRDDEARRLLEEILMDGAG